MIHQHPPQPFAPFWRAGLASLLAVTLALVGCGGGGDDAADGHASPMRVGSPVSAKPGVLSISAMPRLEPYPVTATQIATVYTEASSMVYAAGARGQIHTVTWSALEPQPGVYDTNKLRELRSALDAAASGSMTQYVGIQVVNTTAKELPADLQSRAFDDPRVLARFRTLLDTVVGAQRGRMHYLSIGNEVDVYFGARAVELPRYVNFFRDAAAHARALDPQLKVGVTMTADGVLGAAGASLNGLQALTDVVMLTYYPLTTAASGKVTVRDPSVVAGDFKRLATYAGKKRIVFQEVGYPAAAGNGSSPARQAEFVRQVFKAWRAAGGRVEFLNYFLLHDFTPQMCDGFAAYYGQGAASFRDFLCSLGLNEADGTPRPAWNALVTAARDAKLP